MIFLPGLRESLGRSTGSVPGSESGDETACRPSRARLPAGHTTAWMVNLQLQYQIGGWMQAVENGNHL